MTPSYGKYRGGCGFETLRMVCNAQDDSLPLGADLDPGQPDYEKHLNASARIKRDKQCITTEDCYANHDQYLNDLRGGPGFGERAD